jgi:hypothetical protein
MIVTDKKYYMDEKIIYKLDLMCDRCSGKRQLDNLLIFDGDEGYGKTNFSFGCGYYMAHKLNREMKYFFDLEKLINYAISTEEKVIIWDEGALGGLTDEWFNKLQIKLIKLLMVARKKRHIYIVNIPKFFKLREYIIVDRAICLIHVYSPDETNLGYYTYYNKKRKEKLWYNFKSSKKRSYKNYYNFKGKFIETLSKIVDEKEYDKAKDIAILGINSVSEAKKDNKLNKLKYKISLLNDVSDLTQEKVAKHFEMGVRTLREWKKLGENNIIDPSVI